VKSYASALYRYAYRITGDKQTAEDMLQETFMEAWRCVANQGGDERARGWLFQILRRRCAHFFRSNRRRAKTVSLSDHTSVDPPDSSQAVLARLGEKDALQSALSALSEPMRETFVTVFVEGRTCRETAELQKIPLGTVLSRLHAARQALRESLAGRVRGTRTS